MAFASPVTEQAPFAPFLSAHAPTSRPDNVAAERSSQFELLRIIAMLFIIAHHVVRHSGALNMPAGINLWAAQLLDIGGKLGVNVFVMISAYFLVDSRFRSKKLFLLICETVFYSFGFMLLFQITGISEPVGTRELIKSIFAISYSRYWFATAYVGLYLLFPFLNRLMKTISQSQLGLLLVIMTLYLSIIPTVTFVDAAKPFSSNIVWFVYLYLLIGYLKKYPLPLGNRLLNRPVFCLFGFLVFYLLLFGLSAIMTHWQDIALLKGRQYDLSAMDTVPQLFCSLFLFYLFKNIPLRPIGSINTVAKATFGVYLIHDHPLVRPWLWNTCLDIPQYFSRPNFWYVALLSIAAVFAVCSAIDLVRIHFIEKPLSKWIPVQSPFDKIDRLFLI